MYDYYRTNRRFGELQPKKYRYAQIKAVAHYNFLFFDQFKGTKDGKVNSFKHIQGKSYKRPTDQGIFGYYEAKATWTQYVKEKKIGSMKRRWDYGFSTVIDKEIYWIETTYTGKWKTYEFSGDTPEEGGADPVYHTYYPIYLVKVYRVMVSSDLDSDDGRSVWDNIEGIPIYYMDMDRKESTSSGNTFYTYSVKSKYKYGIVTTTNPADKLNIVAKCLISIEETDKINYCEIPFSHDTIYNGTDDTNNSTYRKGHIVAKDGEICVPLYENKPLGWGSKGYSEVWNGGARYWMSIVDDYGTPYWNGEKTVYPSPPSTMVLASDKTTYICAVDLETLDSYYETVTMNYYHKVNATTYEVIKIKNYKVDWHINQNEGDEHQANSMSMLAPDPFVYVPIVPALTHKLSFYENLIIAQYSYKQYWSFWDSVTVSGWVQSRSTFFTIVGIVVIVVATVFQQNYIAGLVAKGFMTIGQYAIATALNITGMILSIASLLLPSDAGIIKNILGVMGSIAFAGSDLFTSIASTGICFMTVVDAVGLAANITSAVFDMVYQNKQKALQNEQESENNAFKTASERFSNASNMLGASTVSTTYLANMYNGTISNSVVSGLTCDQVTDLMRDVVHVGDIVDLSMNLNLDVFVDLKAGTGNNLFPTA